MKENWYALCISIIKKLSIDKAVVKMGIRASNPSGKQKNPRPSKYSKEFVNKAKSLKQQGKSYKEIGLIMGLSKAQVLGVIRMHVPKKATKNPDQSVQSSTNKNTAPLYHMDGGMQVAN